MVNFNQYNSPVTLYLLGKMKVCVCKHATLTVISKIEY